MSGPATPPVPPLPDDPRDDDGLAAQRTLMSWTRSGLSFAALAALVAREGAIGGAVYLALPIAAALLSLGALLAHRAWNGYAGLPASGRGVAPGGSIELAAAGAVGAAAGCAALVLLG